MDVIKSNRPTAKGPSAAFTGDVYIEPLKDADTQSSVGCAHVRFMPGARSAWHSHPKGQILYVTDGVGYVCRRGGEIQEIRPGDVVVTGPDEEHWHGATPDRFMSHVAIQESDENGVAITWLEHVTDEEYGKAAAQGK